MSESTTRTGVSVVELLIAVAIVAVSLAVAIPTVQQAREASRKA